MFCREFNWGHTAEYFYDDDVITVTSLELRTQSVSAVFCRAVFSYNSQHSMQVARKVNKFNKQTCLNVKH